MKITSSLFHAHIKCLTKCWLKFKGEPASGNPYAEWVQSQNETYCVESAKRLLAETPAPECAVAPPAQNLKSATWRLAVDVPLQVEFCGSRGNQPHSDSTPSPPATVQTVLNSGTSVPESEPQHKHIFESGLHALERLPSEGRGKSARFIPIRFVFTNKLGKDDKLLLAFDAFVLSGILGREISLGRIIHGDDHAALKVKTSALIREVRKQLEKIATLLSNPNPPDLILNRHCAECEFQARCRKIAIEKDDLSLLAGMSAKERQKLRSKGIFTVTQLSYTFRPRRRPKRLRDKREKYHHSLKALAIREKKIHTVGSPELKIEGTPVYLDVEGLPDRDFYYLIGVRIGNGESAVQHSLWADTIADEGKIWREFLAVLEAVEKPVLIHYGSYETDFLKRMRERYGEPAESSVAAKTTPPAVNLLSLIFAQIYFPTFSNGLKEIGGYLGFRWSESNAAGAQTIGWRHKWAVSREPSMKSSLVTYNAEDCEALEAVANKLIELPRTADRAEGLPSSEVVDTEKMKWEHPYGFKRNTFAFPELDAINDAAYWDYQRERIYVKSNANVKRALARPPKSRTGSPPNKTIECHRPRNCPECASAQFVKHTKYNKTLFDLKFMRYGIKRWITRYRFHRYLCQNCGTVFQPKETCWGKSKHGPEIVAYALYLNIELRLPQIHVASKLNRLFGFHLDSANIGRFKAVAAKNYKWTYDRLVNRLCCSRLLHADETKINLKNKAGFVWVFANMEEVAYVYRETREGDLLQAMLKDFHGVLVSDFYAAYDSIQCPQQKCLIHLIRDLNDDVLKHPYDDELKTLAQAFAVLVKPMIESIDRHGLKARFLKKHLISVNRFYRNIPKNDCHSETAVKFKDRLQKNRNKLFTFLSFDGVPWNNNNAEHAVKPFAALRHIIGGVTTEKGLRDYLVLLSICETCKYMGLDFLDFLRSGEQDIHAYAENQRRGKRRAKEEKA